MFFAAPFSDVEPYFLIALKNEINRLSINGTKLDTVSVEVNTIEAIDYHYRYIVYLIYIICYLYTEPYI